MMLLKTSSGITYNKIKLTDKLVEEHSNLFVHAQWDYRKERIELFTGSWKQSCTTDDEYYEELIYIITHEVLHSVIEYAIAGDDYGTTKTNYNEHYPYLNGMDPEYVERMR